MSLRQPPALAPATVKIQHMMDKKKRILVIDDDLRLRDLLKRYLSEQGYAVQTVADATAMRRLMTRENFDLLVLDLMLPGEDGLRSEEHTSELQSH